MSPNKETNYIQEESKSPIEFAKAQKVSGTNDADSPKLENKI